MNTEVLYRYVNRLDVVMLDQHRVIRRTKCGTWIDVWGKQKFVMDGTRKRFAYPTEPEAKTSFLARKRRQLVLLRSQIEDVEASVLALKEGRINDHGSSRYVHY